MKCPVPELQNWGFKKDGSCERELFCDSDRLKVCGDVRKEKSKIFQKLLTQRDKVRKKMSTTRKMVELIALTKTLGEIKERIIKMSNE